MAKAWLPPIFTVSYTHLDVYKRQSLYWMIMPNNKTMKLQRMTSSPEQTPQQFLHKRNKQRLDVYKRQEWYQTYEDELMRFPRDKHDDQVDATAYLGLMIDKIIDAPTKEEIEDEEYERDKNEGGLNEQGRNLTTGY